MREAGRKLSSREALTRSANRQKLHLAVLAPATGAAARTGVRHGDGSRDDLPNVPANSGVVSGLRIRLRVMSTNHASAGVFGSKLCCGRQRSRAAVPRFMVTSHCIARCCCLKLMQPQRDILFVPPTTKLKSRLHSTARHSADRSGGIILDAYHDWKSTQATLQSLKTVTPSRWAVPCCPLHPRSSLLCFKAAAVEGQAASRKAYYRLRGRQKPA